MDRQITEQIVDNALLNDKEGFMSAFQAAMATKVADALEVKKVEVASNMLGAAEVAAQEDTLEEEVEQIDEISKDLANRYRNRAWNWVSKAVDAPGRYWDGRKTVAAQQAYLNKAAKNVIKAGKRLKSMELADKKFSAKSNATHVVPATSKYTKEEVEQIDEGKNPYQLFADHPKFQEAHDAIDSAVKAGDVHAVVKAMSRYSHVGAQDSESRDSIFPRLKRRNKNVWYDYDEKNWHKRPKKEISEAEQIDEAKTKMTDAHKKIAKQVHRDLKSDEPVSQAYGFRVRQMHNLIRKKYGSNWRALAGINEEVEQIDEMEKDVSGPGRDGAGAHFVGSRDKKPIIKMTGKERKTSDALAGALKRLAAKKLPK